MKNNPFDEVPRYRNFKTTRPLLILEPLTKGYTIQIRYPESAGPLVIEAFSFTTLSETVQFAYDTLSASSGADFDSDDE